MMQYVVAFDQVFSTAEHVADAIEDYFWPAKVTIGKGIAVNGFPEGYILVERRNPND